MAASTGNPVWHNNAKNQKICGDCPKCDAQCILVGRRSRSPKFNLIFLFESPDREAILDTVDTNNVGNALNGNPRNFLELLSKRLKAQLDLVIEPSVIFAVGAYYPKDPASAAIGACSNYVRAKLIDLHDKAESDRSVIVPFGRAACRSLNLKIQKISDARGKPTKVRVANETFHVLPTLSLRQCMARPNYFELVLHDVITAIGLLFEDQPVVSASRFAKEYEFPESPEDIGALVDRIIAYTGKEHVHPDNWPVSVDIETTGFMTWASNARILSLGVSWDKGKAATILLDHKDNPQDTAAVWPHIRRLLESQKPKIYHNAYFDVMWLAFIGGCDIESTWWDTMLGEHFINENIKGFYSLKKVLLNYAPQFAGYEDQMWKLINESKRKDIGSLIHYIPAPQKLVDKEPSLKDLEDSYLHLTLEHFALKSEKIDDVEKKAARTLELKEITKKRQKLRQSIRKLYAAHDLPPPDNAKIVKGEKDNVNDGLFERVPIDVLVLYNAIDADLTRRCCKGQRQLMLNRRILQDGESVMRELYIPAAKSLSRMRHHGIRIDQHLLEEWMGELDFWCTEAEELIRTDILKSATVTFNPNSPDDIARVLTKTLGVPYSSLPLTPTGKVSTKAELIEHLGKKHKGTKVALFCYYALLYRAAQKARSTYLGGIHRLSIHDGKIHTALNLHGTTTGRLSSSQPNFQNLPKDYLCRTEYRDEDDNVLHQCPGWPIKRLLVPTDSSYALFDMDVSAAEIRVLCGVARDENLIRAVNDGLDVPSFIAAEGFTQEILDHCEGSPEWRLPQDRRQARALRHALRCRTGEDC
jgi:DNA polymerase I-like protein with 3'-5' exonuclease and polymerase domains